MLELEALLTKDLEHLTGRLKDTTQFVVRFFLYNTGTIYIITTKIICNPTNQIHVEALSRLLSPWLLQFSVATCPLNGNFSQEFFI